jgi:hypothetical protein
MKTKTSLLYCAAALGAVWLAGCSTPETRIRDNPEAFARLNPDQQALVKTGQVGIGFDMSAVKLALGEPDRITLRTNAAGQTQVWHYVEYVYYDSGFIYPGPYYGGWGRRHGGWGGWGGWWGYEPYGIRPAQAFDRFRIEFKDGKVSAIAQEKQV